MASRYTGVSNLLNPDNCTMILIDHQPLQFADVQNIDVTLLVNNVVGLTKTAKVAARLGAREDDSGNWRNHVEARWKHRH